MGEVYCSWLDEAGLQSDLVELKLVTDIVAIAELENFNRTWWN